MRPIGSYFHRATANIECLVAYRYVEVWQKTASNPSNTFSASQNPNMKFGLVSSKPAGWVGTWHDGTLHPTKLDDAERKKLSREGRCWSCRGSGHRDRDACCIRQKVNLNKIGVEENSSESSDSEKE